MSTFNDSTKRFANAARWSRAALVASLACAAPVLFAPAASATVDVTDFGVSVNAPDGQPERRAGAHADITVRYRTLPENPADPQSPPKEIAHRVRAEMPPGVVGDPRAIPACAEDRLKAGNQGNQPLCPIGSQVGVAHTYDHSGAVGYTVPVYNVTPPPGKPALFAFNYLGVVVRMTPEVRPNDHGITIDTGTISQGALIYGADVTLWGVPADSRHDSERFAPLFGDFWIPGSPSQSPRTAFLSNPTSCSGPTTVSAAIDGWDSIGDFWTGSTSVDFDGLPLEFTGCENLPFDASIAVQPTGTRADGPSGLEVDLQVAQNDAPDGLAAAHVKDVSMLLPEGMSVAPGSAAGLGACSPVQIGLGTDDAPSCPRSSKLGTVTVETPLLKEPMTGDVILATPDNNPFGSLVALYIVAEGSGVRIKLPGRVDPNPVTGQLTATFSNNPQLPFSALKVRFDGGENASLATPTACGRYETKTTVTSWSGKSVDLTSPMVIDQNCGPRNFALDISAGSVTPLAGKDSTFLLNIARSDGQQNLSRVTSVMPPGLLARIGDVPVCGEAQANAGTCPDASLVGSVRTTAGPGSAPLPVNGRVYLTGPYNGGPYGLSIVVPTAGQAGPFDLGNVVVRARITVDRTDGHVEVLADPMPTILRGFPLRIRSVAVAIDRSRFMFNPSSCTAMKVGVSVTSTVGGSRYQPVPYRLGGCRDLEQDQKIRIAFTNKSQTRPGKHPGVEARMTSKGPGVANLKKVAVKLPLSVALDPKNAKALCKPGQREAKACPKESIVGRASAKSVLKDELTGPVYFVEGTRKTASGRTTATLPKLWIPLSGGGVTIDVNADSHVSRRKLVSTFANLPDAPITEFRLRINSGKHGILAIPPSKEGGTCQRDKTVDMQLTGHNGAVKTVRSKVNVAGCKKKSSKKKSSTKKPAKKTAQKAPARTK